MKNKEITNKINKMKIENINKAIDTTKNLKKDKALGLKIDLPIIILRTPPYRNRYLFGRETLLLH